jgi:alkylation response protein AidB-like acyl-CoA dehydrogenase
MDFLLNEEERMMQEMAKNFAEKEVKPVAAKLDQTGEFPVDLVKKMGELGLMGVNIPEEYGGAGLSYVCYAIAIEEIARYCGSTSVIMSVNNSLVCAPLLKFGTEDQKKQFLTPLASGKKLGCFGLTEPNAGSDAGSIQTTAVKDGDYYILNGSKIFITNATHADIALIFASTDKSLKHKGISCFIVEKGTPGFSVGKIEHKLGINASGTAELVLQDVRIPASQRLGNEGEGFKIAMYTLDCGRIGIAAQAVGIARGAFEEALKFAKERVQFGKPISEFQAIQWMLADMATEIDAARLLTRRAAFLKDSNLPFTKESSMAKVYSSEVAMRATTKAIQIHGGYGYSKEYPVERFFRDAKITEIYEGTSEIQRLVIANQILR